MHLPAHPQSFSLLAFAFSILGTSVLVAQGDLDPPTAPAPSMRTLDQIYERIDELNEEVETLQTHQLVLLDVLGRMAELFGTLEWTITRADGFFDSVGEDTSLAYAPSGYPGISYLDSSHSALKYTAFNGTGWDDETVETGIGSTTHTSLAYTPSGKPVIAYYHTNDQEVKLAKYNGTSWDISTVDSFWLAGHRRASLAINSAGYISIAYPDGLGDGKTFYVRYTWQEKVDGLVVWKDEIVANDAGNCWMVLDPDGNPAIAYVEVTNAKVLKLARKSGGVWTHTDIETLYSPTFTGVKVAARYDGDIGIAYTTTEDSNTLKYHQANTGLTWVVESGHWIGAHSVAFFPSGTPAVAYHDASLSCLKFAGWNGSDWTKTQITEAGDQGLDPSLAFSPEGYPAISFHNGYPENDLEFAIRQPVAAE